VQNVALPVIRNWIFLALWLFQFSVHAQQNDQLLVILNEELSREMLALKKTPYPPYYLSYRVDDVHYSTIQSSFGSLIHSDSKRNRVLSVSMRLGDYSFDNTHPVEEGEYGRGIRRSDMPSMLPLEDRTESVKFFLWNATDKVYRNSLEMYKTIKSPTAKPATSAVPDFSKERPEQYFEPQFSFENLLDRKTWEDRTRELSALFQKNQDLISGEVSLYALAGRKYFVSSEGTSVVHNTIHYYLYIDASIRAEDGDVLPLHITYFGITPEALPSNDVLKNDITNMLGKLEQLKKAPLAEPYTGPAILDAQAAGVFFHEIFGHRVEGHRLKDEMDGQTFKAKINEQVLPKHISVIFDPTLTSFKSTWLNGTYKFDDEGVKAKRVVAVMNGMLQNFLMSRTPLDKFPVSNGHGRASAGAPVVSRQSNLLVETTKAVSMDDLRKMLVRECKRQGKPYGYYFKDVVGGFTNTERFSPNAFNIFPTEVYRIYADGRPDEIVRGVDLIGTPLAMFAEIAATGDAYGIFHGFCGAESGSVPVSAISPALFVKRIETQKKPKEQQDTMLLSRPFEN
jgi:TldD protein